MPNTFTDRGKDFELGARRMQVVLLRDALRRYGRHADYCTDHERCRCGLRDALNIGPDAREACGLTTEDA